MKKMISEAATAAPKAGFLTISIMGADPKWTEKLVGMLEGNDYGVMPLSQPPRGFKELVIDPPSLFVFHQDAAKPLVDMLGKLKVEPALKDLPLLCVCPKAGPIEVASVLDAGADDCLARPFSPEVFQARVRAILRRLNRNAEPVQSTQLKAGPIEIKLLERTATVGGVPCELTRLEFELLAYLMSRPGQAVTRTQILQAVWKYPADVETRTLDKHVESLRKKLEPHDDLVETVRAVGYRIKIPS